MQRVVVVGCGGIGGVIAAHLTRAGVDVTPVTGNEAVAAALREHGFRVQEFDGERWQIKAARPPQAALTGAPEATFDLCVLATKATTMKEALSGVAPFLKPEAPVIFCQNGLPEERASEFLSPQRMLGCVVGFGATMREPGVYERTSRGGLQLGRPSSVGPDPAPWARLLEAAAPTRVVENFRGVRWSKLAINCATSTLGAIGGDRLGSLLRRRFIRRLVLEIWTEINAVARAAGVRMARVGGTMDISRMALSPRERAATLGSPALALKHSVILAVGMKYRRMRSSMLIALERGRTPEIDFLNGEVVRQGAERGVPTPVNARLVEAVHSLMRKEASSSISLLRSIYEEVMADRFRMAA